MKIDLFSIPTASKPIAATDVASGSTALPGRGNTLRIVNAGPNVAFIAIASGTATATLPNATPTNTSNPIGLGESTLQIPIDAVYNISAICNSGQTAALTVQVGEGA